MAALNFPNSPSLNDTHTENGVTFKWNGAAWDRLGDIGAQGAAGAAGAQGAAGAAGAAGAQGATGPVAGSSSQVVYKDGSNNPAGSSSFTFDGTNLTVGGNVSIGGTLTYEDVTNIDSVGLITARAGVKVPDNQKVFLGTDSDLEIYHDGSNARIKNTTGQLWLQSDNGIRFVDSAVNESFARFTDNGAVELYYDGGKKFETTSSGVEVSSGNLTMPSNGRIFVGNGGNAANPMFANVSDTNTGIAFPATDTMMFTTGGTERLRITSDGRMGLGCTPDTTADFHIRNSNAANLKLGGSGNDATGFSFNYSNSGNTTTTIKQHYRATSASALLHIDTGTFTLATGTSNTERLRITSGGQVNIGGNYTQTSHQLQVDGGITGDYFVGRNLSHRNGFKWGASGIYYYTLGGSKSSNGGSFTMFEVDGMQNSKFVEFQLSFGHSGGGSHGSYRRVAYQSNGYQGLITLEDTGNVNYGGGGGFTISKPNNTTIRVVWNGASGYASSYVFLCEMKSSSSGASFQNVNSAFS